MTLNDQALRQAASQLYEADLKAIPPAFSVLLEKYSKVPVAEQLDHVLVFRNRAYESKAYPCLGRFRFLDLDLSNHPLYDEVLQRLRSGNEDELFLDFGCCIGQDIRKLLLDGAPASNVYGADLLPDFIKTGFELFRDETTFPRDHFVAPADAFDETKDNALAKLDNKVSILHISAVFHLFGLEQQRKLARRCLRLLSHKKRGLVLGGQTANVEAGEYPRASGSMRWRHNSESWSDFWQEAAKEHEGCKVEAHSRLDEREMSKTAQNDTTKATAIDQERSKVIGQHEDGFRWMVWWTWVDFRE